ncbi:hypothetical protein FOXYSP1_02443 [Fusarium oxysporum f. sp. phaseoli]
MPRIIRIILAALGWRSLVVRSSYLHGLTIS